jgi:hypothetical protein
MKINMSVALKAGLIGLAIGVAFTLIINILASTILAPIVCVICWLAPAIGLVTGALYVHFSGGAVEMAEAAVGGALAGAIGSVGSAVVNIIWALVAGSGDIAQSAGGIVGGAVLGAIGGVIYKAIKK